uniref:Thyroglobulin type-1 domain-containing protein n=1 Tax=Laticauda laticaudata TaxID=8630 RepID=A0A8C5S120_LATLA
KFHCRRRADRAGAELNMLSVKNHYNGNYKEIQCKRGECWCVDLRGKEIPGSRVRGTNPRCPTIGSSEEDSSPPSLHPRTCREERRREQRGLRGLQGRKGP